MAMEAVASVRNAAKGAVIQAARETDHPTEELILGTAVAAVDEARKTGVDIIASVIGVVEGAAAIAHLLGREARDLAGVTADAVRPVVDTVGPVARARVDAVLESLPERK